MTLLKVFGATAVMSLTVCSSLAQTTISTNFTGVNKVIPDGQLTGVADSHSVSFNVNDFSSITDLQVSINITNGFNGDFYGYLVHDSGFSVLFNREGRASTNSPGYADKGLNVTFMDSGNDLHFYRNFTFSLNAGGQLLGNWAPDGRYADPSQVSEVDSPSALLGSFNGLDPNGTWTLFLADVDFGEEGTLVQWGLTITAIPEPSTFASFGLGLGGLALLQFWRRRRSR